MIVKVPFTLIHHLLLVFFITTQRVSSHHCSYDSDAEAMEDFEPDYYQEVTADSFGQVVVSEEPLGRVVGVPHSQPCDDYYYVEESVVRQPPPSKKTVKQVRRDVEYPPYCEKVLVSPRPPPRYLAPIQVFDDTDMC